MKQILGFFKSVRLAVGLILYIAITSVLATLVPQGKEVAFYYSSYSPILAGLIVTTQFHVFFRSFLFLIPSLLFFINLSVCAADRLIREFKKKAKMRIGVDLVHLGILLLIIGGIVTFAGRREGFRYLGEGDQLNLPGDFLLRLEKYEFQQYPDGRPKDWISVVDVEKNGKVVTDSFPIEVNRPLQVGSLRIYQSSYAQEMRLAVRDAQGNDFILTPGQFIKSEKYAYRYQYAEERRAGTKDYRVVFEKWEGHNLVGPVELSLSERIGDFELKDIHAKDVTGLQFVIDPGALPIFIALIVIMVGLSITYIRKIGDEKL